MPDAIHDFEQLAEAERIISERASPVLARIARQVEEAYQVSLAGLTVTFAAPDPAAAARGGDPNCVVVIADIRRSPSRVSAASIDSHMLAENSRLFRRQANLHDL